MTTRTLKSVDQWLANLRQKLGECLAMVLVFVLVVAFWGGLLFGLSALMAEDSPCHMVNIVTEECNIPAD